jgi:hypothetical protein
MLLLLTSYVCEYCDGPPVGQFYRGFVVWRGLDGDQPRREYVFRTREIAAKWRELRKLEDFEIREVLSENAIGWRRSRGSVKDIELADRLYYIYPDHRFPPAADRAFLAPEALGGSDDVVVLSA